MAFFAFLVGRYAQQIYLNGTQRFTAIEGFSGISADYHEPVKAYAAQNYYKSELDQAHAKSWITPEEYEATLAYGFRPDPDIVAAPTKKAQV